MTHPNVGAQRREAGAPAPAPPLCTVVGICIALSIGGCGGAPPCVDPDGDGYGPGCPMGADCDPNNAARNTDCAAQPAPDCQAQPTATGCPCLAGGITQCLADGAGVGRCMAGTTTCLNGFWGSCQGAVGPLPEVCDGKDQDCDGLVDEGVMSPCGGCTPGCTGGVWGQDPDPFMDGAGLSVTHDGALTLATVEHTFGNLWVANTAGGTLSKIDTSRAVETARYPSGGTEPTRVAVDYAGDAWVLDRTLAGVPSLTKVAGEAARCVDRNGDGLVTSSGPGDVLGIDEDECVLLHVPVGGSGGVEGALAIDGTRDPDGVAGGNPWVGLRDAEEVVELDGVSGQVVSRIPTPGFSPYAAAFDRWGTLWMIERDGVLLRVDPRMDPPGVQKIVVPLPCYLLYGLAPDPEGRLLMTGFSCDDVILYDPVSGTWAHHSAPPSPRAVGVHPDGRFWVAHTGGQVSEVALDPLRVRRTLDLSSSAVTPFETIGAAVDASDQVWTVSSQGGPDDRGVATRLDPDAETVTAQVIVGGAPHDQGDLTGARVRTTPVDHGSATHVFGGCGPTVATDWVRVHVDADPGTFGQITVEVRHAPSRDALSSARWSTLGTTPDAAPPYDLSLPTGGAVEVRLTLAVNGRSGAPRVWLVGLEWRCPGPG